MTKETINGITYECSDKYSDKGYAGWDLSDRTDMDGLIIHGLCLSNETPDAKVLPPNLKGTTFIACNLDNVFIPSGNNLKNCSIRRFKVQNDGEDWLIDKSGNPTSPINAHLFVKGELSVDPKDIPAQKLSKSIVIQADEIKAGLIDAIQTIDAVK